MPGYEGESKRRKQEKQRGSSKKNRTKLGKMFRYRQREEGLPQTPLKDLVAGNDPEFNAAIDGLYSRGRSPRSRKAAALESFGLRPRGAPWEVGDSPTTDDGDDWDDDE